MGIFLKNLFYTNKWTIAYRIASNEITSFQNDKTPYILLDFPKNFWGADPFLCKCHNKVFVFCEYMDEKKSKSIIAYKELYPKVGNKWLFAVEVDGHISYPCIFKYKDDVFMIPEVTYDKKIIILKKNRESWDYYSTISDNITSPDTTFFILGGKPCLFVYEIININCRILHIFELDDNLKMVKNDIKVKIFNEAIGRPGGSVFTYNNVNYRVTQSGLNYYGEKVVIKKFSFVNNKYFEEDVFQLCPKNIKLNKNVDVIGVHTYNKIDNIEVIDLQLKYKLDLLRPFKIIFKRLGLFGYGLYEKRRQKIYHENNN